MSRPIAYNASGPLSGSIRGGSVNYTVDSGNRDYTTFASKKWVPSADGAAPIVFVTDSYTQGITNQATAVPLFYSCNGTGSAAIIYTANRIPGSPGNYSDANVALNDLITARGYFILESNDPFEGINADNLAFDVDASKMSSYPQTGTNWRDLSGKGTNGTLTNGPTWNSNGYFTFDATDDYVNFPNDTALNSNSITVSSTFNPTSVNQNGFLFEKGYVNTQYALFFENPTFKLRFMFSNIGMADFQVGASTYMTAGRWYNAIVTYDSSVAKMYINGTLVNQATYNDTIQVNNNGERIGAWYDGGVTGYHFNGSISNTQVYPRALTETQVKQNYFGSPIVTDGLVFAVDANNIVSYPKSGTSWYNLTGSNIGTFINGPTFNQENGGSIKFDGTDDYVNVPTATNLNLTSQGTVSVWINPATVTQGLFAGLVAKNAGGSVNQQSYGLSWRQVSGALLAEICDGAGTYNQIFAALPTVANVWYNIVFTWNGSQLVLYNNGVVIGTTTQTINNQVLNTDLTIGGYTYKGGGGSGEPFNGKIANVKLYNRGLTAAEVIQNYQSEQYRFEEPLNIPTFGLQAYWDASNLQSYPGSGTTWTDTVSSNAMTWSSPAPQWNINQFTTTPLIGSLRPMITSGYTNGRTGDGAYSVVAIFKPLSTSANQILFSMGPANNNCSGENIHPIAINSAGRFGGGACGGLGTWTTGGGVTPTTSKYYCVVTTFSGGSGGTETVYVDGVFDKSATMSTSTPVSSANRYGFGWIRDDGAAYGMNAELGVIMYYNRALTSTEVAQIYNSYKDTYQF